MLAVIGSTWKGSMEMDRLDLRFDVVTRLDAVLELRMYLIEEYGILFHVKEVISPFWWDGSRWRIVLVAGEANLEELVGRE